jgi:3-isopropylmalate dehydrogenase
MSMHLMNQPRNYDVVLTENLFGDILSDESAVITGSLGMLPSATIGGKVNLYEPVHGSAPDIAGKGLANPLGAILTGALILRHSAGLEAEASAIETAVRKVLEKGFRTPDLARTNPQGFPVLSTTEMGKKVRETVKQQLLAPSR